MQQKCQVEDSKPSLYDDLYQRHAPVIFASLLKRLASREEAEDVLLDTFLAAMEHSHFAQMEDGPQLAWLWRVAMNKATDRYRRSARHPRVSLEEMDDVFYQSDEENPEEQYVKQEEHADLYASLQQLPALQQEALRLRFGYGLNNAEVGQVLHKSEGAIRVLIMRTLRTLRGIYTRQKEREQ